jgi:MFS family permease
MCIIGLYIKGDWGWRLPCIFQIVGPIAVLSILITAPESPRYLVKKGRHEEALAMLAKFHANGDTDDQLVAWELKEITVALEQELIANKSSYVSITPSPPKKSAARRERDRSAALLTLAPGRLLQNPRQPQEVLRCHGHYRRCQLGR